MARWKVKYQRAVGYIALGTFVIVLYSLVRDLHASPFFPLQIPFYIFVVVFFGLAAAGIIFLAEMDWRYVFLPEQGQGILKNPLLYTIIFQSAWLLAHHERPTEVMEEKIREAYKSIGVEKEFQDILRELRR